MELDISPDFTVEDIRKVRDYDYEMVKDMTPEQADNYHKSIAASGYARMEQLRRERVQLIMNSE